jgi:hypothetical protein
MTLMAQLSQQVRGSIRLFAFYLANGTLALDVLDGVDYRKNLMKYGSDLEQPFAVFANVLDVDDDGHVTNDQAAGRRAAQWIRAYCDSSYVVEPPFEDWETELVL